MMEFNLQDLILSLNKTPVILNEYLKDLPEQLIHQNEGENTWSPFDIVGHLIHGEKTDWMVRAEIIVSNNQNKEFEVFDRFAQFEESRGKTINQLLREFESLRHANINKLRVMNPDREMLLMEGIHPEFGAVTLQQLLSTWMVHDMGHISQISRVLSKQYKNTVGPWVQYLKILNE
ncbi:MAG: DinB family protein [Bacteroidota bacterium]